MSGSNPSKVLRVAVIVDAESCEELHQTEPGDVLIERAGRSHSTGPSLDLETGVAADGTPRERLFPTLMIVVGALLLLAGAVVFGFEVSDHINANAMLEGPAAEFGTTETDATSTIAMVIAMLGVIPLMTGATMLRGRRSRAKKPLTVYDGWSQRKDHRKLAPLWLGLGVVLVLAGGGLFGFEVSKLGSDGDITEAKRGDMAAFQKGEREGTGGLGLLVLMIGIVPLVAGIIGMSEEPVAPRKREPKGGHAPQMHRLFEWVAAEGVYYIDIPPETRGKLALGKSRATVEQLRQKFGTGDTLRVKLGPKAKGKLLIGQTKILFQTASPAAVVPKPAFPTEFVDPLALLRPTSLDVASLAATTALAALLGVYFVYYADRTPSPPAERFTREMGMPASFYEEKEEEPVEDAEEDALVQKDEEKVDDKKEVEIEDDNLDKPDNVSQEAFNQARGVGVARVLGTYGGPGEGTVLDVIEGTENNLGDLFAQGMSNTANYQGGEIGDFVAGGGGIDATGTVASNEGIKTGDGPAEIEGTDKKERKVKGSAKGTTDNVFGDVDKKAVSATIRQRMPGLQACYEKALRSNPNLKGKMSYTITINPQGRVTDVEVEEDTINDGSVKSCTIAKIKGWRFFSEGAEESSEVTFSVSFTGS